MVGIICPPPVGIGLTNLPPPVPASLVSIQKNVLCRQESRVVCPLDLLYTGRTKNIWRSVACNQGAVVWQKILP